MGVDVQPIVRAQRQCVRAAKEMDPKSIGLCPQGFESPRCRQVRAAMTRVALPGPEDQRVARIDAGLRRIQPPQFKSACCPKSPLPVCSGVPGISLVGDSCVHGDSGWLWVVASNRFFGFNDSVSERPRRWTRNPLGSARRGSYPLAVDKSELR